MFRAAAVVTLCLFAAGCGGPLDNVTRLSEVDLPEDQASVSVVSDAAQDAARPGGLLGLFKRDDASAGADGSAAATPEAEAGDDTVEVAAASGGGFFGLFRGGGGAAASEMAEAGPAAFGTVVKECGVGRGEMGRQVESYPSRFPKYRLYDSEPGNAAPHAFYVTGFSDGCPRQVIGALGVFGGVQMHELMRYSTGSGDGAWGRVDKAYEIVKARVCGVVSGTPCGSRVAQLERGTVFLTMYESFSDRSRWTNVLLHDGKVEAFELQSP
ncbi:hypothetical protein ATO6_13090 [Oceanicola sp. 22II-s10i]|uniref:hypothetical protein n=1 Tax=Oceanicola sp. 22II-s10i TaxID=1317116 RepID=UPI000B524EDE|nr:hypothetical protein [Oceanicola sp. 22II-s10i]OWU84596.1 hypothetical protein ATO6_13090 [Oceanicola sp. 22II-s10i]